jgi:SAM-dependent methyltransferase
MMTERDPLDTKISSTSFQHQFWQKEAATRDYNHPVIEFFAKQRIEFVSKYIPVNQIDNILDVGSGRGYSAVYLSNNNSITATDFSFTQIKKNPVQNKIVCTSEKLPYGDESFSLVNEWELLHHLPDPIKAVNEMSRVAKDYLVLFEPNRQNPGQFCFSIIKKEERNVLQHHKKMMYELVKNIDFDILACETVGWVFPNRMPEFILPLAKKLPFNLPIIGLSNVIICKRRK